MPPIETLLNIKENAHLLRRIVPSFPVVEQLQTSNQRSGCDHGNVWTHCLLMNMRPIKNATAKSGIMAPKPQLGCSTTGMHALARGIAPTTLMHIA